MSVIIENIMRELKELEKYLEETSYIIPPEVIKDNGPLVLYYYNKGQVDQRLTILKEIKERMKIYDLTPKI